MMPCITHVLSFHHRKYHIIDTKKARYHDAVYEISPFFLFRKNTSSCIVLHCLASSCIVLHRLACLALTCIILHCLASSCIILHCPAFSYTILHCLASSCIVLHHLASSCIIFGTETPINTTNVNSFFCMETPT